MKANVTKIVDFVELNSLFVRNIIIIIVMRRAGPGRSREVSSYTGIYQLISTHHHQEVSPCE